MAEIRTDLCVIGAGAGGLSVAAGAVQMGARVVLIEAAEMGGDCLNSGCVPSKALLAAAKQAHALRKGAAMGILPITPQIDFAAVKDHVARSIATIAPIDSQARFEGLGVRVIRAHARFTAPDRVEAAGDGIRARRFVIATGSRPAIPDLPGLANFPYLTNETIFALRERPDHLLILGAGAIGVEMAQAHARLGCRVTLVARSSVLAREDAEAVALVTTALRAEGVQVLEGAELRQAEAVAGGVGLRLADGSRLTGSHLLVATGRRVALEDLGLQAAGVAHTAQGVTCGPGLRSVSNRRVYAVGDAAGLGQLTHLAGHHAGVVIRQVLFGLPARADRSAIPRAVYTDPELAQIGLTEAEARTRHGARLQVLRQDLRHNDRAVTEGGPPGLIKLMVVGGRPVGVTLVGPAAGELIGVWALAMAGRLRLGTVAGMVLPYPTYGEVSKRAAGAYFSPKLFDNPALRRVVRLVQRLLP